MVINWKYQNNFRMLALSALNPVENLCHKVTLEIIKKQSDNQARVSSRL